MNVQPSIKQVLIILSCLFLVTAAACDNTEEPAPPSIISIESGNGQISKYGSELYNPLRVKVLFVDLSVAEGVAVRFRSVEGGGTVSPETDITSSYGIASTRYTLGAGIGPNRIRAELVDDVTKYVEFEATAGEYYCAEEDTAYTRKFPSDGVLQRDLFLFTRYSKLNMDGGQLIAGIVKLVVEGGSLKTYSYKEFEEGFSRFVVHDISFSRAGDLYLSLIEFLPEAMKIAPNRTSHVFSALDSDFGSEITTGTGGVLAGCDERGPFAIGCRDTLQRFAGAMYTGVPTDMTNYDAVAVDTNPGSAYYGDIYYIDLSDYTLRRLPLRSLQVEGPPEIVVQLDSDEALGAGGMVCDNDGTLYVLVEDDDVKSILHITPEGLKSIEYDFFDRGPGNAAGIQSDLAIQSDINFLYTIDTLNDMLLLYDINQHLMIEMFPDTLGGFDPESISTETAYGEHVGLIVLPGTNGP